MSGSVISQTSEQPAPTARQGVVVTVCTYNERENLTGLLEQIFQYLPQAHVLIVDDNSPDGTGKLADSLSQQDERIKVKHRLNERGLGTATLLAFRSAVDEGYEYLINLDADFSHHPRYLPDLLASLQQSGADVAIGSRYISGGKIVGWPVTRHLMSRGINHWSRFWLGLKTRDCSGSYRCYRCDLLERVDFSRFRSKGYAVQEELLYRCAQAGAKFVETPITFEDRLIGESKISLKEAWTALKIIARCGLEGNEQPKKQS